MALLRGNLHAHTTYSDGVRTPAALVREYESRGYDFLAITDHEDHDNWVEPGYREALDQLHSDLLLFRGIELNFDPLSQRRQGDRRPGGPVGAESSARYKLSVAETVERADRPAGGLASGAEVTDTGFSRPLYDTDEIPLAKSRTDDAHRPPHFGGRGSRSSAARRDHPPSGRDDFRMGFAERLTAALRRRPGSPFGRPYSPRGEPCRRSG
jgi:hypothetical protein